MKGRVEQEWRVLILRKISCFHRAFQAGRLVNNPALGFDYHFQQARKEERFCSQIESTCKQLLRM